MRKEAVRRYTAENLGDGTCPFVQPCANVPHKTTGDQVMNEIGMLKQLVASGKDICPDIDATYATYQQDLQGKGKQPLSKEDWQWRQVAIKLAGIAGIAGLAEHLDGQPVQQQVAAAEAPSAGAHGPESAAGSAAKNKEADDSKKHRVAPY